MVLQICPLNKLYQILRESNPSGAAAVISTSCGLPDPALLRGIPYVCREYRDIDFDGPGAFSDADAEAFAAFIRTIGNDSHIHTVYVCCDAAFSRSPAVCAAIALFWEMDSWDSVFYTPQYTPNMFVFRKLAGVLGMHISDEDCDMLLHMSRKAFQKALNQQNSL